MSYALENIWTDFNRMKASFGIQDEAYFKCSCEKCYNYNEERHHFNDYVRKIMPKYI